MPKIKPHWQIVMALILATVVGLVLQRYLPEDGEGNGASIVLATCRFLGVLFLNALKMIIVPLVVASVILGIGSLGTMEGFGRLGGKTILFYACSSLLAIIIGLTWVNTVKPGLVDGKPNEDIAELINRDREAGSPSTMEQVEAARERGTTDVLEVFKRMIPVNVVAAAAEGQMLGLIFFSILFGAAMTRVNEDTRGVLVTFFSGVNDIMIMITNGIMKFAPIGVFSLLVPVVAATGVGLFKTLGIYFLVVVGALGTHLVLALPVLLKLVGRVNPRKHFGAMKTALLTAFSTSSSAATLPVTMECVREEGGVSKRVSSFTLPLGATVNMDGTALYECVAVIFVTQAMGWDLTFAEQFTVVLLALLTSIGVAGVPQASLVAIIIIFQAVGFDAAQTAAGAAVILTVDRILDMSRTAVNVFSDSCAAVVIARTEGEELPRLRGRGAFEAG
ncbi:MAG: dicarboxylate/amino acid:cation symporter [Verrucomicrobiota bacterium]